MSIPRVKSAGWGLNEKLTSAQITALDQQVAARALDKSPAGDTLSGVITVAAASGFLFQSTAFAHFQSGAGPLFDSGSFIAIASGSTVNITNGFVASSIIAAANIAWTLNGAVTIGGAVAIAGGLSLSGGFNVALNSRSITRVMAGGVTANAHWAANPEWSADATAQTNNLPLVIELKIPHGSVLNSVTARLQGGGNTLAPATMPKLSVQSIDATPTIVQLGSVATDSSSIPGGSPTGYNAAHDVVVSGLSVTIDRTAKRYYALIYPEAGTNSIPGSPNVILVKATWTQTSYEED